MATRGLMDDLAKSYTQITGVPVSFLATGGVDAARRVLAGEAFDVVVLASDAIDKLIQAGKGASTHRTDLVRSSVGVAVKTGAKQPDISTGDALRHAVIGQDVEKLTDALLAKAQEMARLSKLNDYVAARRRLAIARASIWTPDQTTDAMESARAALAAGLADLRAKHNIRPALLVASRIGYSTGPSGVALIQLFERWGIADQISQCLIQAPPGVPVGSLLARGEVDLGFQQMSELIGMEGIELLGPLSEDVQIQTIFSAVPVLGGTQGDAVQMLLEFMTSHDSSEAKFRHGMEPA